MVRLGRGWFLFSCITVNPINKCVRHFWDQWRHRYLFSVPHLLSGGGGGYDKAEWKILKVRTLFNLVLSVDNTLLCMFQRLCTFQHTGVLIFGVYVLLGHCSRQQISVKNEGFQEVEGPFWLHMHDCWEIFPKDAKVKFSLLRKSGKNISASSQTDDGVDAETFLPDFLNKLNLTFASFGKISQQKWRGTYFRSYLLIYGFLRYFCGGGGGKINGT